MTPGGPLEVAVNGAGAAGSGTAAVRAETAWTGTVAVRAGLPQPRSSGEARALSRERKPAMTIAGRIAHGGHGDAP